MATEMIDYGAKLEYKVGAGAYTEIIDIVTLTPPNVSVHKVAWQALRSQAYEASKPGPKRCSPMRFRLNIDNTAALLVCNTLLGDETLTWKITHSDATSTIIFAGWISEINPAELDPLSANPTQYEVVVEVNGTPTFA